jgi:penicillin-binding protein 2
MKPFVQRSDVYEFRRRYRYMLLLVVVAFALLSVRLVQLQIAEGPLHRSQARRNIVGRVTLATTRGVVRDTHGRVLAANRPSYDIYVVPGTLDMKQTWPLAVQLMGLGAAEEEELRQKILRVRDNASEERKLQQTLLKVDAARDVVAALETHAAELAGIDVVPVPVRYYPYGTVGAHLLGYMREIDAEALARADNRDYRVGDRLGAVGIERRWESYLKGQRGWKKVVRGANHRSTKQELEERYLEEPRRLEPIPGRDISLTVDVELEKTIEREMRGQLAGAVVVVEVRTGRVLAAVSKPSFDPNILSGEEGKAAIRDTFVRLSADPLKPMLDKTTSAAYPPGSTYKPFSALAGLADGLIDPETKVDCRGGYEFGRRFFRCTDVHRRVNLHEAIVRSCNTYFYALGESIHIDRLAKIGMEFGFGSKTGLGINPESRGRMPTRAWYTRRYKGDGFRGGFTLLASIGQGATTVSVLQLALAYGAVANNGTLYQPQVVRSIETSDGTLVQEFPPAVRRVLDVDPQQLTLIKGALKGVVTEAKGTANKERIAGVDMAGKTGTAQVSHVTPRGVDPKKVWYFNRDHAWFAGYAPADSPEIAIVVLVEHGGGGGKNAVPVAMRVVDTWQKTNKRRLATRTSEPEAETQPVRGASL